MVDWRVMITKVENGFVLEWETDEGDEDRSVIEKHQEVVEIKDSMDECITTIEDREGLRRVFYFLMEHFGMSNQKHDHSRLNISLETREGLEKEWKQVED